MNKVRGLVAVFVAAISLAGYADEALEASLISKLKTALPDAKVTGVKPSPISGIYEVMLGPSLLYMSSDGRFVFQGDVFELESMRNLSDERRAQARVTAFEGLGSDSMIEFAPANGEIKHTIYVYTDVDCAYCRKMHKEIEALTGAGIAVRYLAYPRSGVGSESYNKAVAVWCSTDRQSALTVAKLGKKVSAQPCDNPVDAHLRMGRAMGVRGTPSVYAQDGSSLGGYTPARELIRLLDSGRL